MNSFKIQTLEKLSRQRAVLIASKSFADIKLAAFGEEDHRDKQQFINQKANCEAEIKEYDACINWLKVVVS